MMTNEHDRGAWWVEGDELHIDVPRLLENMGMVDTEESRDEAVAIIQEAVATIVPGVPTKVIRKG